MKKLGKNLKNTKKTLEAFSMDGCSSCSCNMACNCSGNRGTAYLEITKGMSNVNSSSLRNVNRYINSGGDQRC